MSQDIPSFRGPTIVIDRKATSKLLQDQNLSLEFAEPLEKFIHLLDFTVNYFQYNHHKINEPIIAEYNKALRDLLQFTEGKIDQVTGITFHTQKGSVNFQNDSMTNSMFRLLLAGPRPNMTVNGNPAPQFKYMTATDIIFPLKEYSTPDSDQLFNECIKQAIPLGKMILSTGVKKAPIRKLIESTITQYFEWVIIDRDINTNKQAFKINFWPLVERVT